LVLLDPSGDDHVAYPAGSAAQSWYPRPGLFTAWRAPADAARWVSLAEHHCQVDPPARGTVRAGGPAMAYPQSAVWWVSDPVTAARQEVTVEGAAWRVAESAAAGGGWPGSGQPVAGHSGAGPLDRFQPITIEDLGITYRFQAVRPAAPPPPAAPRTPSVWGAEQHEAYRFYRDVIAGGPHGLAALWLLYHPEQARDVLEWTVTHRDLLSAPPDTWEQSLASMLQDLTGAERAFIGVKFAEVLSDAGVPQGEQTLDRIRRAHSGGQHAGPSGDGVGRQGGTW
jgi:hypothetical protein